MNQVALKTFVIAHYRAQSNTLNLVSVTRIHVFVEVTSLGIHMFSTLHCEYIHNEFNKDMKEYLLVCYLFKQTVFIYLLCCHFYNLRPIYAEIQTNLVIL